MTKVPIVIAFLTVFAQPQCGLGIIDWSKFPVPGRGMTRVSTIARPPLSSPFGAFDSDDTPTADIPTPSYLKYGELHPLNNMLDSVTKMSKIINDPDVEAAMKSFLVGSGPSSASQTPLPIQRASSLGRSSSFREPKVVPVPISDPSSDASNPQPQTPSTATDYWKNGPRFSFKKEISPTPVSASVTPSAPSDLPSDESKPVAAAPSSPWAYRPKDDVRKGASPTPTPLPTTSPAPSCAANEPNPSIDKYRRKPTISRMKSYKPDDDDETAAVVESTPPPSSPSGPQPSPRRYDSFDKSPSGSNLGSSGARGSGAPTVVSEKLPKNGGTIDIRISGTGIDDERMSQMIKEARNAITAVFHMPLYEAIPRGKITYAPMPSSFKYF